MGNNTYIRVVKPGYMLQRRAVHLLDVHHHASPPQAWGFERGWVGSMGRIWAVGLLVGLGITVLGVTLTVRFHGEHQEQLEREFEARGRLVAAGLDVEALAGHAADPGDLRRPAYLELRAQLKRAQALVPEVRWFYLMGRAGHQVVFLVDSVPEDDPAYSPPGDAYVDAPDALIRVFREGQPVFSPVYEDSWGQWRSVFVPILGKSGEPYVLGLDFSAAQWDAYLREPLWVGLSLTLLSLLCWGLGFKYLYRRHQLRTALVAANMQLAQARDAAQSANRAKREFLAVMSHELRTPLNGIMGFSNLLRETPLRGEQQEFVEQIQTCGHNMLKLVAEVLEWSRIEGGHVPCEPAPFALRDTLDLAAAPHVRTALERGLEFCCLWDELLPRDVVGDEERLKQALSHLLDNAVKFTDHGAVTLAVRAASRSNEPGQLWVTFEVQDTGVGIRSDQLVRLFRPFSLGDSSNARRHGGTGLGLVIARKLCESMGGEIVARSRENVGSTFQIDVPFGRQESTPVAVTD